MDKSKLKVNGKELNIDSIKYNLQEGLLSISGNNPYFLLNININKDITTLDMNKKDDISKDIYLDQNYVTENYSYVIGIDNIYLTRVSSNNYLIDINLPKVDILITPFDNKLSKRVDLSSEDIEINSLEVKAYFKL